MPKQKYKSVSFDDATLTLAFSSEEAVLFDYVKQRSSLEIKEILATSTIKKLKKDASIEQRSLNQFVKLKIKKYKDDCESTITPTDVTFANSKNTPFQRWFPYIEGYSLDFVKKIISNHCKHADLVYEPFAGTGTTIFAADSMGKKTVYSEVNPLLRFLIDVKIQILTMSTKDRKLLSCKLEKLSQDFEQKIDQYEISNSLNETYNCCFGNSIYFPEKNKVFILKMKTFINELEKSGDTSLSNLLKIAVCSILIPVSFLKRQGDVRFKTEKEKKNEIPSACVLVAKKLKDIAADISKDTITLKKKHILITENAKNIYTAKLGKKISAVITSPPYLNGTNYFRNTKLELWFLGFLKENSDLRYFRNEALTSGINDVVCTSKDDAIIKKSELLKKTIEDLQKNAYDKRIPLMALAYFSEMETLFVGLKAKLEKKAKIIIDLGDSIFSGIHVKTDFILADILKKLGYSLIQRDVLRKRRSKNGAVLSQILLVFEFRGNE